MTSHAICQDRLQRTPFYTRWASNPPAIWVVFMVDAEHTDYPTTSMFRTNHSFQYLQMTTNKPVLSLSNPNPFNPEVRNRINLKVVTTIADSDSDNALTYHKCKIQKGIGRGCGWGWVIVPFRPNLSLCCLNIFWSLPNCSYNGCTPHFTGDRRFAVILTWQGGALTVSKTFFFDVAGRSLSSRRNFSTWCPEPPHRRLLNSTRTLTRSKGPKVNPINETNLAKVISERTFGKRTW